MADNFYVHLPCIFQLVVFKCDLKQQLSWIGVDCVLSEKHNRSDELTRFAFYFLFFLLGRVTVSELFPSCYFWEDAISQVPLFPS